MEDDFLEDSELNDASWLMIDSDPFVENRPAKPLLQTQIDTQRAGRGQTVKTVQTISTARPAQVKTVRNTKTGVQQKTNTLTAPQHVAVQPAHSSPKKRPLKSNNVTPSTPDTPTTIAATKVLPIQKNTTVTASAIKAKSKDRPHVKGKSQPKPQRRVIKALKDLPPPQQTHDDTEAIIPIKKPPPLHYIYDVIPPKRRPRKHVKTPSTNAGLMQGDHTFNGTVKTKISLHDSDVKKLLAHNRNNSATRNDGECILVTHTSRTYKNGGNSGSLSAAHQSAPLNQSVSDSPLHDHGDAHSIVAMIYDNRDPTRKKDIGKTLFTNRDAVVLRRAGYEFVIVDNINRFPSLDRYKFANLLLGTDKQGTLAYNMSAFPHIDRAEYAKNMIAVGRLVDIMRNISSFPSVDAKKLRAMMRQQANEQLLQGGKPVCQETPASADPS